MKLKKKVKRTILIILIIALLIVCALFVKHTFFDNKEVQETKVLKKIDKYGYTLKDNKTSKYKKMFEELNEILTQESVDEEEYVRKITEMFIYDFYSLDSKASKTDIGGVDFVHKDVLPNFLVAAEDTYYKYVESNIYNNRQQRLPEVGDITIESVNNDSYTIADGDTDDKAYYVKVNWEYTNNAFDTYQTSAELVFVHNGIRLDLVELQK